MTAVLRSIEVYRSEARAWMEESLRQGFDLSAEVLAGQIFDKGQFLMLVPDDFERSPLNFGAGGVIPLGVSKEALGKFLDQIISRGALSVVVEDDLMWATDPVIAKQTEPLAFVGNRVLHWCDVRDGGKACARTIIMGARGYPLNAFVTSSAPVELGLTDRQQTSKDLPRLVTENLVAVVVAAFDGESFLIWTA